MTAAPLLPELADLMGQLSTQLRDEAERYGVQSDAMRASVEQTSRPSRQAVEDALAAGFRAGKAAALADEAERWSAFAYALRQGWSAVDTETAVDGFAGFVDKPSD